MKSALLFAGVASALALLSACATAERWGVEKEKRAGGRYSLAAPEGYRAELRRTPWALDGVSKDRTAVWIRTGESGCNRFHHVQVREVAGGFRLVAFDVFYVPIKKRYDACQLYLLRHRHRVEFPRPLRGDKIFGECVPRGPRDLCASLHAAVHTRKGTPERDPWLGWRHWRETARTPPYIRGKARESETPGLSRLHAPAP